MAPSRSFCSDLGCIVLHLLTAEITVRPAGVSAVHFRSLWRCCIPSWADVSSFGSGSFEKPVFLREIAVRLCCRYKHLGKVEKLDWSCTPHSVLPFSMVLASNLDYISWCQSGCTAQFHNWRVLSFITEFTLGMILPTKATVGQELATERKLSGNTMQVCWLKCCVSLILP